MKGIKDMRDLFFRKKPIELLLALNTEEKKKYVSVLSREINCTYSHTLKLLSIFEKFGLVKLDKISRVKFVELTEDGKDLALQLQAALRKMLSMKKAREKEEAEKHEKAIPEKTDK